MNDPELKALGAIAQALAGLNDEQRRNVLVYVNARYGGEVPSPQGVRKATGLSEPDQGQYDSIGDLFDTANPKTEGERVLLVAYWLQQVEGAEDFESFPVNKHLKNLGHPVSNITRAIDSLMGQTPQLILQTSKSGSAKQARKKYKVTREGVRQVQSMLARNYGGPNAS